MRLNFPPVGLWLPYVDQVGARTKSHIQILINVAYDELGAKGVGSYLFRSFDIETNHLQVDNYWC